MATLTTGKKQKDDADVHYSRGMKTSHCSICQHWLGIKGVGGGVGRCGLVAGVIGADMWCKQFEIRTAKSGAN